MVTRKSKQNRFVEKPSFKIGDRVSILQEGLLSDSVNNWTGYVRAVREEETHYQGKVWVSIFYEVDYDRNQTPVTAPQYVYQKPTIVDGRCYGPTIQKLDERGLKENFEDLVRKEFENILKYCGNGESTDRERAKVLAVLRHLKNDYLR